MSTTIAFDTHAYVKKLRDAGVDELQAEIQADALIVLVEDRLATKQDIYTLKRDLADIRKDMTIIEANLKRDLADVESNLKRDIKELDVKAESRIKELDVKAESRIKELDVKAESRIKELELRMVIKMGAMIIGGIGLLFGLMRAWPLPVQYVPPPTVQEKHVPAPPTPAQPPVPQAR